MSNQYRVIAFDLDGTLVDTAPDIYAASNRALAAMELEPVSEIQVRTWIGNGMDKLAQRLLARKFEVEQVDESTYQALRKQLLAFYYEYVCVDSKLYDDVIHTLEQLKEAGFALAVVTNKNRDFTLPLIDKLGIASFFELVISGDDVTVKKPDPEALNRVVEHFGIKVNELLMVGDSENDIIAAHRAGCDAVAIDGGYNQGKDLRLLEPEQFIDNFSQLSYLLNSKVK